MYSYFGTERLFSQQMTRHRVTPNEKAAADSSDERRRMSLA